MEETLKEISNINLKDYLERYYNVEFDSNDYCKCINPNHNDSCPSMKYYSKNNRLVCFSCPDEEFMKRPIDIITATSFFENLETKGEDFIKIISLICERYSIKFDKHETKISKEKRELYDRKNNFAKEFINRLWDEQEGYHGMEYLLSRGFTKETIRDFSIGLTAKNEYNYHLTGISDRISIPILDETSNVAAISFRSLEAGIKQYKYIHDKSDAVWDKGETLYGLTHAREHIKKAKCVYVVEGYFDVMAMYQVGIKNVVGSMGGSLTKGQIAKLAKYTTNVFLILDQDKAGQQGAFNTVLEFFDYGVNVRVIPNLQFEGKDMNDVCISLKWDKDIIRKFLMSNSKDATLYIPSSMISKYHEKVISMRIQLKKNVNSLLSKINDPEKKEVYKDYFEKMLL